LRIRVFRRRACDPRSSAPTPYRQRKGSQSREPGIGPPVHHAVMPARCVKAASEKVGCRPTDRRSSGALEERQATTPPLPGEARVCAACVCVVRVSRCELSGSFLTDVATTCLVCFNH
jgi:hypothetical protein